MSLVDIVLDVSAKIRIGAPEGLYLRKVGTCGRSPGRSAVAALRAACTSRPAPSTLRFKSNWMVMPVEPSELAEVISVTPAISPRRRSRGEATLAAIVAGSAPGRDTLTRTVGNSIAGMLATGRKIYAI